MDALAQHDIRLVATLVLGSILSATVGAATSFGQKRSAGDACRDIESALRLSLFAHLQRVNLDYFQENSTGEVIALLSNDVEQVGDITFNVLLPFVSSLAVIMLTISSMAIANWELSIASLSIIPFWVAVMRFAGTAITPLQVSTRAAFDRHNALISERLSLVGVVRSKTNLQAQRDLSLYAGVVRDIAELSKRMMSSYGISSISTVFVSSLGPAGIMLAGAFIVSHGQASVGTLVAFLALQARLYAPIQSLVNVNIQLPKFTVSLLRIFDALDISTECEHTQQLGSPFVISYRRVNVRVNDRDILRNFALDVRRGEHVAIVGQSGCGKSTIAQLLLKLREPSGGDIELDGVALSGVGVEMVRSLITYVPSESSLFDGSVLDNVLYGADTNNREAVLEACRLSGLDSEHWGLSDLLTTSVGLGGSRLSAGERQRIMLARAMLRHRPIYVFDEATSAIDLEAERDIVRKICERLVGCTIVWISHRLASLQGFETIVRIEDGQIIERGSFELLVSAGGGFATMLGV